MGNRTLGIIKPDCVEAGHTGEIIDKLIKAGFKIVGLKKMRIGEPQARKFYEVHEGQPFYEGLVQFMTSGPVIVMALEKDNAVQEFRSFIGATDPAKAPEGSIRREFGTDIRKNCVHGSDSDENANREIYFFFNEVELI
ncbi:MAG: nucleoside-diphosphate kinase [Calditrichia bacterium]